MTAAAPLAAAFERLAAVQQRHRVVPFSGEGGLAVGRRLGSGLGGRLALDLGTLDADSLVVPNEAFYIRTGLPAGFDPAAYTALEGRSLRGRETRLSLDSLRDLEADQGLHLLECAGNGRRRAFGLISSAHWTGVPVADLLDRLEMGDGRSLIVEGSDTHANLPEGVAPTCSWVFDVDQLLGTGAFLATRMNGVTLPEDHGRPLRLIVPGWYGCCCIKWVQTIAWVNADEPSTQQMLEYARRTHQDGRPASATDFRPAEIDAAAMPIRVEQLPGAGPARYRVTGVAWGGRRRPSRLLIRFNTDEEFSPVTRFNRDNVHTWDLWEHHWQPGRAGRYGLARPPQVGGQTLVRRHGRQALRRSARQPDPLGDAQVSLSEKPAKLRRHAGHDQVGVFTEAVQLRRQAPVPGGRQPFDSGPAFEPGSRPAIDKRRVSGHHHRERPTGGREPCQPGDRRTAQVGRPNRTVDPYRLGRPAACQPGRQTASSAFHQGPQARRAGALPMTNPIDSNAIQINTLDISRLTLACAGIPPDRANPKPAQRSRPEGAVFASSFTLK